MAFYIFLYSLGFMVNTLHLMSGLSIVLYLAYMALTVWSVYLGMGTLGFICSFVFTCAPLDLTTVLNPPLPRRQVHLFAGLRILRCLSWARCNARQLHRRMQCECSQGPCCTIAACARTLKPLSLLRDASF